MNGYIHPEHGRLFVADGISHGETWATYYRIQTGSLRRLKSPKLPVRRSREEAQCDLDEYARVHKLHAYPSTDSMQ